MPRPSTDTSVAPRGDSGRLSFIALIPEAAICVVLVTAVVAEAQLLTRSFTAWPTLAVGLVGGLGLAVALFARTTHRPAEALGAVAALAIASAVSLFNATVPARWLSVNRDPGFYTVTARWLVDHPSPLIDRPVSQFGDLPIAHTAGFNASGEVWIPQSSHLLPALAAIGGQLGDRGLYASNALIGMAALLSLYAAARLLIGPWWALVPVAALGVSLPFATFTRGLYTEPLAMAAAMGALALTIRWLKEPTPLLAVAAGALAGVPWMTRIDGLAITVPLVTGMVLARALDRRPPRAGSWRQELLYAGAAVVTAAMGLGELRRNSPLYLESLADQVRDLLALAAAATVFCLVISLVARQPVWRRRVRDASFPRLAWVAAAAVVVGMVALVARPLFWQGHFFEAGSNYARLVASLQARAGVAVDGTRSYDERSVQWISWYLGWPTVVLATAGLALWAAESVRRRQSGALMAFVVVGAVSSLYLTRVSISPDQVWASRRFLPVILPGFLLAATFAIRRLASHGRAATVVAVLLALVTTIAPLGALRPVARVPEVAGWDRPVNQLCARIGNGRLLMGQKLYITLGVTLRVFCDAPVAPLPSTTAGQLAAVERADRSPLYVLTRGPQPGLASTSTPFVKTGFLQYEHVLFGPPRRTGTMHYRLYLSEVTPTGRLVPLRSR